MPITEYYILTLISPLFIWNLLEDSDSSSDSSAASENQETIVQQQYNLHMPSNETITSSTPVRRTHLEVRRTAGEELTVGNSCLRANENPVVTEHACSGDVEEDHSGLPGGGAGNEYRGCKFVER